MYPNLYFTLESDFFVNTSLDLQVTVKYFDFWNQDTDPSWFLFWTYFVFVCQ